MSWQGQTVIVLRELINDAVEEYTHTDMRLEHTLLVSGFLLLRQVSFTEDYIVDVEGCSISPDPSTDYDFLALMALRAAVLILSSEYKTYTLSSISVSDGPSSINMTSIAGGIKALLESAKQQLDDAILAQQTGNSGYGAAILSPYGSYWSR